MQEYRKEIDGLRAVSVIAVIIFHLNENWLPAGFLGVDIFFVISGFLIFSIINKQIEEGTFTLRKFWSRRIRRILPLAFLVATVTIIATYLLLFRNEFERFGLDCIGSVLSISNIITCATTGDYWGPEAETTPFLHYWSLSVEEQFYLLFPLLLLWIKKTGRNLMKVFIILSGLSLVGYIAFGCDNATIAFYLTPLRAWELLFGAMISIKGESILRKVKSAGLISNLLFVLLIGVFFIDGGPFFTHFLNLLIVPLAGGAILFLTSNSATKSFLSSPVPVYFGKISFSLYLWHWPVMVILKDQFQWNSPSLIYIYVPVLTFILSVITYHCFENPVRRSRSNIKVILLSGLVPVILGLLPYFNVVPKYYGNDLFEKSTFYNLRYEVSPVDIAIEDSILGYEVEQSEKPEANQNLYHSLRGLSFPSGDDSRKILVIGDSHAIMWSKLVEEISGELGCSVDYLCANGVPPYFDIPVTKPIRSPHGRFTAEQLYQFDLNRLESIRTVPYDAILIGCRWEDRIVRDGTKPIFEFLEKVKSNNANLVLFGQPRMVATGNANVGQFVHHSGLRVDDQFYLPGKRDKAFENGLDFLRQAEGKGLATVFWPDNPVRDDGAVLVVEKRSLFYYDDDHLSYEGTLRSRSKLKALIETFLNK